MNPCIQNAYWGVITPDLSAKGLLKTPRFISPEKIQFIHLEGSNPSLTFTLFQSSQVQPFNNKILISSLVRFRYLSFMFITEHFKNFYSTVTDFARFLG